MLFRLDRFLNECDPSLTRKTAKALLHGGSVSVNGNPVRDPAFKVNTDTDIVCVGGKTISYQQFRYYLLNKPSGVLSASRDKHTRTVVDLIDGIGQDFFPVGRLDKDTEGLLIITNDGALTHEMLSPKKHVPKTYIAQCSEPIDEGACEKLRNGIDLGDFTSAPAGVLVLTEDGRTVAITITEGKFHQVKRMVEAVGSEVIKLRRIRMGGLWLPYDLAVGESREMNGEELKTIMYGEEKNDDEERLSRSYL